MSAVDWTGFRKCPVCHAPIGEACMRLTSGGPGAVSEEPRDRPHTTRRPRRRRTAGASDG